MMAAKAPPGFYTTVEIIVILKDHRSFVYSWTTPMALSSALHKAPAWAKQELKAKKVRGRSTIVGMSIEVQYKAGGYKR